MICETIKFLRERNQMTQSDLAKTLGITRSSVNAWEMGINSPSSQYLVELAQLFKVSTDYLLGIESAAKINIDHLAQDEKEIIFALLRKFGSMAR
ncbi:MAG: helix-turn-helix domain-containing protein [Oscillospiraceae bacterium]|jgi:transcriptional regulator with XRE-family HTH domain|nr:helix-turn-helix domain-containing protein [Oscillospiraceae bacterium]